MRAEAIVWNAVAPVSSAFAPTVVFMLPMLGAMALPNLSRFRAPVCGPVGLAPVLSTMIGLVMIGLVITPTRLRMMLPVLPVVFCTFLPVLALIVSLVVSLIVPLIVIVAPVLVRVLIRASVFLSVLVVVLSARVSSRTKS